MENSEDIHLEKARKALDEEINRLRRELKIRTKKLAQLDKILQIQATSKNSKNLSEHVIEILQESDKPLSAAEITERLYTRNVHQRAKNPQNSVQALLHHLKKKPGAPVIQDPQTRKWSAAK